MHKYKGSITHRSGGKYEARITEIPLYKVFDRREDAEDFIKEKNVEYGLERNKISPVMGEEEVYKCDLGNGREMIFDGDDMEVVQSRLFWFDNGIAITRDKDTDRRVTFSSLIMSPMTNDQRQHGYKLHHLNRNRLDYRKSNMRWTSPCNIKIDAPGFRNNQSTGLMGICKRSQVLKNGTKQTRFIVQWTKDGRKKSKTFTYKEGDEESERAALKEAISHRKSVLLL